MIMIGFCCIVDKCRLTREIQSVICVVIVHCSLFKANYVDFCWDVLLGGY